MEDKLQKGDKDRFWDSWIEGSTQMQARSI